LIADGNGWVAETSVATSAITTAAGKKYTTAVIDGKTVSWQKRAEVTGSAGDRGDTGSEAAGKGLEDHWRRSARRRHLLK
jgi:hypothetical protein